MPKESSQTDIKRWRDRLAYARKVWTQAGIMGQSAPSNMRVLIEFYRGNQWQHLDTDRFQIEPDELRSVNKIYPAGNQILGAVASRNKRIQLKARKPEALQAIHGVESLLQYDVVEQNHLRQENAALRDHLFAPFGCIRHGFTPAAEFHSQTGRVMSTAGFRGRHVFRPTARSSQQSRQTGAS